MIASRRVSTWKTVIALAMALPLGLIASVGHAQTTYQWDTTGVNPSLDTPANWVGGVAPGFTSQTDSLVFSASTNAAILLPNNGNGVLVNNITFDGSSPAYSFTNTPDFATLNDIEVFKGTVLNQSNHTQDFTGIPDIYLAANSTKPAVLDASGGDPVTHLGFKLTSIVYTNGSGFPTVQGAFDTSIGSYRGLSATQTLYKTGAGTLFVTDNNTGVIGRLTIGSTNANTPGPMGAVRIGTNDALGAGGSTSANYTSILGGANNDGRLELTNNINTSEGIILQGRQGDVPDFGYDNSLNPAIVNVSGNNTMSGPFSISGGGGGYNFASTSGSLTVTQNLVWNFGGTRYVTAQGAGAITFSGSMSNGHTTSGVPDGALAVEQLGTGTLTLGGSANANIENLIVANGGTLAFGATAGFTFATEATETGLLPQVFVQGNGTLDVSAVTGGYTLTQSLQGTGNVVGSLTMAAGTQVVPGGGVTLNNYAITGVTFGVGQLHFHNNLNMSAGSQMVWHLGALSTTGPGTNFDQLTVDGALALGGSSSLSIDLSLLSGGSQPGGGDPFWNSSHTWTIISNSNNPGNSNFASIVNGVVATGTFTTSVNSGTLLGDVNGDHVVNGLDIAVVASHWLLTGATLGQGDANGDGTVNGLDIALIASHWLSTGGGSGGGVLLTYTPSAGGGTAVPEPSTFVLAALGLLCMAWTRQRRLSQK